MSQSFHFLQLLMLKRSSFPLCLSQDNQKNGWAPSSTPHTYLFPVQSEALKLKSFCFFFFSLQFLSSSVRLIMEAVPVTGLLFIVEGFVGSTQVQLRCRGTASFALQGCSDDFPRWTVGQQEY